MFRLPQKLIAAALGLAILISPLAAQSPQVPPGDVQLILPPAPKPQPTPAVDVKPETDDLNIPFAIVATVGGEVRPNPVVEIEPGDLLTLTLEGTVVSGDDPPDVAWTSNRETKNFSIFPANGRHVTFSHKLAAGETHAVFLFSVAINNPDATKAPFIAQRWVVVGLGPIPPPVIVPVPPVDPVIPPVVVDQVKPIPGTGLRAIILVDETTEQALPKTQKDALSSVKLLEWIGTNFGKDTDGLPLFRKWDGILKPEQITESEDWKAAFALAKERSKGVRPWIEGVDSAGRTVSQALPADEESIKSLLKK